MVSLKYRCACITRKGYRCKKAFSFVCDKTRCCTIHVFKYITHVLTIQKMYKGYHCRKYVKLLARLPCDIQRRVVFYIRESFYNTRRNNCIQAILCKRFVTIFGFPIFGFPENIGSDFVSVFLGNYRSSILTMNKAQFNDHILQIAHLYKLYTKYLKISNIDCDYSLYTISSLVKKDIEECLYYYHHSGQPYFYNNAESVVLHNNVFELQKSIGDFKSQYNIEYKSS